MARPAASSTSDHREQRDAELVAGGRAQVERDACPSISASCAKAHGGDEHRAQRAGASTATPRRRSGTTANQNAQPTATASSEPRE